MGEYQPDVYAWDESGELLIEVRVTHAVDDRKASRVQALSLIHIEMCIRDSLCTLRLRRLKVCQ